MKSIGDSLFDSQFIQGVQPMNYNSNNKVIQVAMRGINYGIRAACNWQVKSFVYVFNQLELETILCDINHSDLISV